jgi:hypothetical protein
LIERTRSIRPGPSLAAASSAPGFVPVADSLAAPVADPDAVAPPVRVAEPVVPVADPVLVRVFVRVLADASAVVPVEAPVVPVVDVPPAVPVDVLDPVAVPAPVDDVELPLPELLVPLVPVDAVFVVPDVFVDPDVLVVPDALVGPDPLVVPVDPVPLVVPVDPDDVPSDPSPSESAGFHWSGSGSPSSRFAT